MSFLFAFTAHAQVEGRVAAFTLKVNTIIQDSETTSIKGSIENTALNSGLYFSPKTKNVHLPIPEHCKSLTQIAFAQDLKIVLTGKVLKFEENIVSDNELVLEAADATCTITKPEKR